MNLNIFTNKVNDLITDYNQKQEATAGDKEKIKENFQSYQVKAENLIKEFREDQKGITKIEADFRKALYMLSALVNKLKEKKETNISKLFNVDPFGGVNV